MVKKIISSIILIMIICSSCILYATNVIGPEDTTITPPGGQETVIPTPPDDTTTNGDTENNNPTPDNNDSNINDNTNTDTGVGNDNNGNIGNNDNNNDLNNENQGQTGTNTKPETQKPTYNNNQGNNIVLKSSEARLKDLKIVNVEGLTPAFDKNTTEYYLVVDLSVTTINIKASTVDNKAKWAIYGNKNLKKGENTVTINVTAEDGTKKEYYIYVTKVDNIELANAELESLDIGGFNLYPSFKANIYSYNLNINQDISTLNIKAIPSNKDATVTIEGNKNLKEGENIIKINVTAANKETVRTYKINTYISTDRVELKQENKLPALILIIVLGICIIAVGTSIVVKNKR